MQNNDHVRTSLTRLLGNYRAQHKQMVPVDYVQFIAGSVRLTHSSLNFFRICQKCSLGSLK